MLYHLTDDNSKIKPLPFEGMGYEKHLENLLASHLFETVFEDTPLLPFHQERRREAVADIYALNQDGDIVIFELKSGQAAEGALDQLLRYAENAGQWGYTEIQQKYNAYVHKTEKPEDLAEVHLNAFNVSRQLNHDEFNRQQHLWVVACGADDALIRSVEFWKRKGLSIDFLPYRIYRIGEEMYFEFFSKPYDRHLNPSDTKGVLFDTNRSYDLTEHGCLKDMLIKQRVSAYGNRKDAVDCFKKGDMVFFSHKGVGVVGAARVKGDHVREEAHPDFGAERYLDVDLLTVVPRAFDRRIPAVSFNGVSELLGHGFYWARTDKRPYLSLDESDELLLSLKTILG